MIILSPMMGPHARCPHNSATVQSLLLPGDLCMMPLQVWVLWVPTTEVKDTVGYTDHKVDVETGLQASKPTARQAQEMKEQVTQVWDNEDSLFATSMLGFATRPPAPSTSASSGATGAMNKFSEVQVGNRKSKNRGSGSGRGGKCGITLAREAAAPSPSSNGMAVEAQRFRKNTIKACGQRAASR